MPFQNHFKGIFEFKNRSEVLLAEIRDKYRLFCIRKHFNTNL